MLRFLIGLTNNNDLLRHPCFNIYFLLFEVEFVFQIDRWMNHLVVMSFSFLMISPWMNYSEVS